MSILNRPGVDFVVVAVCAEPLDEHNLPAIVGCGHQPVVIALDVEHHTVGANDAGSAIAAFDLGGVAPLGSLRLIKPRIENASHRLLSCLPVQRLAALTKGSPPNTRTPWRVYH